MKQRNLSSTNISFEELMQKLKNHDILYRSQQITITQTEESQLNKILCLAIQGICPFKILICNHTKGCDGKTKPILFTHEKIIKSYELFYNNALAITNDTSLFPKSQEIISNSERLYFKDLPFIYQHKLNCVAICYDEFEFDSGQQFDEFCSCI